MDESLVRGAEEELAARAVLFNEARGHINWLIVKSPTTRGPDGNDVDLKGIFDGIDTSSLAAVKTAIEKKDSVQFAAAYKTMLESCYACHKSGDARTSGRCSRRGPRNR